MVDWAVTADSVTGKLPSFVRTRLGQDATDSSTELGAALAGKFTVKPATGGYSPVPLSGTYSARPVFSTVTTGQLYYATDTLEVHRATGTPGSPATGWTPVPSGGTELAYSQTITGATFPTGNSAAVDVPGVSLTFVAPERPVALKMSALTKKQGTATTTTDAVMQIRDGSNIIVGEFHAGSETGNDSYLTLTGEIRIGNLTPGASYSYKLSGLSRLDSAWATAGYSYFPTWIQAVAL